MQKIVDSQTVKTTEGAQEVGYDGGKLVKGHKRHLLVDTLGLLLQVVVSAANGARESWSEAAIGKDKGSGNVLELLVLFRCPIRIHID